MSYQSFKDPQYNELMGAHHILERVLVSIDKPDSVMRTGFQRTAMKRGCSLQELYADEINKAMHKIGPCIPCRFEGVPSGVCECPECDPD